MEQGITECMECVLFIIIMEHGIMPSSCNMQLPILSFLVCKKEWNPGCEATKLITIDPIPLCSMNQAAHVKKGE